MTRSLEDLSGVVVGLGSIGNRHLNNLLTLGVGTMSVVRRKESPNTQFDPPANVGLIHSLERSLDSSPDFAVICNPSHLHASTAKEYLQNGTHVLIEKPLCRSLDKGVQSLIDIASGSNKICAMAYCMRYHPAYRLAKEKIQAGAIGRCLYAKAWFEGYLPDWHPWEDYQESYAALPEQGGGVLRTLDHELDFLNWVLGPATDVKGFVVNTGGIGIEADDLAMYSMSHPAGVNSQVTVAFCRKPQSRGFEFVGEQGVLSFTMEQAALKLRTIESHAAEIVLDVGNYDANQMYVDLVTDFLHSVVGNGTESLGGLDAGVQALMNIEQLDQVSINEAVV